jgi:4-carboxymuconolactone decarboxylase
MSRLGPIPDPDVMDEAMKAEYDSLVRFRKGAPPSGYWGGPYDPWFRSPELCHQMRTFGLWFWEKTSLDRGIVELAICVAAWHWQANVEWTHANTAIRNGIPESVLDDVQHGRRPNSDREDILTAYDVSRALLEAKSLSDALYARALAQFSERGITELAGVVGFYTMVAFHLRVFDVEPNEDGFHGFARPVEA